MSSLHFLFCSVSTTITTKSSLNCDNQSIKSIHLSDSLPIAVLVCRCNLFPSTIIIIISHFQQRRLCLFCTHNLIDKWRTDGGGSRYSLLLFALSPIKSQPLLITHHPAASWQQRRSRWQLRLEVHIISTSTYSSSTPFSRHRALGYRLSIVSS